MVPDSMRPMASGICQIVRWFGVMFTKETMVVNYEMSKISLPHSDTLSPKYSVSCMCFILQEQTFFKALKILLIHCLLD